MPGALAMAIAMLFVVAAPASATVRDCGNLTTTTAPVTFRDTSITARSGTTCVRARQILAAFARKRVTHFEDCAVPSANGGECSVLGYNCFTFSGGRGRAARGECVGLGDREIRFNESQRDDG